MNRRDFMAMLAGGVGLSLPAALTARADETQKPDEFVVAEWQDDPYITPALHENMLAVFARTMALNGFNEIRAFRYEVTFEPRNSKWLCAAYAVLV